MKDNATTHKDNNSLNALAEVFGEQMISQLYLSVSNFRCIWPLILSLLVHNPSSLLFVFQWLLSVFLLSWTGSA
jgi:hypothetical protein